MFHVQRAATVTVFDAYYTIIGFTIEVELHIFPVCSSGTKQTLIFFNRAILAVMLQ
jgi:hypothetical protein